MLDVSLEYQKLQLNQRNEVKLCFSNSGNQTLTNIIFTLNLPGQVLLLKGKRRVEIPQLKPGERTQYPLTVIPKTAGKHIVNSPNFSYRKQYGRGQRIKDFYLELNL